LYPDNKNLLNLFGYYRKRIKGDIMEKEEKFIEHPLIKPKTMQSRLYQEAMLGEAVKRHMLCVMPTALGKTNIAILLAAHRLKQYPQSKIMVLAPTRPLVSQHSRTFKKFMKIPEQDMQVLTGMVKPIEREQLYKEKKIIFATPQTIQKDLENKRLSLKEFSLLVADEAHHSVGRYAYPYVAKHYLEEAEHPRILGLTASPGGTSEKIKDICKSLGIDAVEVRTEQDEDVIPYIKEKEVDWEYVDLPERFLKIKSLIEGIYRKRIASLRKMGYIHRRYASKRDLLSLQQSLSKSIREGNKKAFGGMTYTVQAIKLEHAQGLLETQGVHILDKYWSKLRSETTKTARQLLNNKDISSAMLLTQELIQSGSSHPKMAKLCSIVGQQLASKPDSKIIIFANFRETVKQIAYALEKIDNVRPVMLVGQKEGLSQKEQMDVIRRYNEDEYNCLITTSIGEEGLDIPAMDLAVFYEPVPSEIRSIQRRGRVGRQKIGRVIVLVTRGTRDEAYKWSAYHKERRMHRTLYGMKNSNNNSGSIFKKQRSVADF
jgi:Fanconi anemia group M protein